MEKVYRFAAKYFWAVYAGSMLTLVALYAMMLEWDEMPGVLYLVAVTAALLMIALCMKSSAALLNKAYKELEERCDPEPFLKEATEQLSYSGNWIMKLSRNVNAATAMMEVGEYAQAYDMMVKIRDDISRCMRADVQLVYYNNMAQCCMWAKRQEAGEWSEKMLEAFQKIKSEKMKKKYQNAVQFHKARMCFDDRDYVQAMKILDSITPDNLRHKVHLMADYGKVYHAMGEMEKVKAALAFVVENGNKLYVVQQARQMLTQLDNFEGE